MLTCWPPQPVGGGGCSVLGTSYVRVLFKKWGFKKQRFFKELSSITCQVNKDTGKLSFRWIFVKCVNQTTRSSKSTVLHQIASLCCCVNLYIHVCSPPNLSLCRWSMQHTHSRICQLSCVLTHTSTHTGSPLLSSCPSLIKRSSCTPVHWQHPTEWQRGRWAKVWQGF